MCIKLVIDTTFSLRSSLNVSDQVSHPYKTTGKIIVVSYSTVFKTHFNVDNYIDIAILFGLMTLAPDEGILLPR